MLREIHNRLEKSSDKWDNYFRVYERHAFPALNEIGERTLVEVGVQNGGSLEMWAKATSETYCKIHGIDVDPACAELDYSGYSEIQVHIGDQGSEAFWDEFLAKVPQIDVFIDDGGHFMDQQILTLKRVWPHISPGGVFICEDTHTSYQPYNGGGYMNPASFLERIKDAVDNIHAESLKSDPNFDNNIQNLASLHVYDSIVVLEKQPRHYERPKRVFPDRFNKT